MWLFWILIITIIILGVSIPTNDKKSQKRYIIFIFFVLAILMMFRAEHVGNDTDIYTHLFGVINNSCRSLGDVISYSKTTRFEEGYVLLNWILGRISSDPQILFIVTGAFTAFSFGRFVYRYSDIPWFSVLMFMTLQFYDLTLTGVRQIVAISILLFSYDYIVSRKPLKFFFLVLIASSFHRSSVLFSVLFFLCRRKADGRFYLISGMAGIAAFSLFSYVLIILNIVFPAYIKYFENEGASSYSTSATLAVFLMLALWLLLFLLSKYFSNGYDDTLIPLQTQDNYEKKNNAAIGCKYIKHERMNETPLACGDNISNCQASTLRKQTNVLEISTWISIIMLFLALHGTILTRYKYVFSVALIAYYPNSLFHTIRESDARIVMLLSVFIFIAYILIIYTFRPEWQSSFPYSFFWS